MFGKLGKQFAAQIGDAVEDAVGQHLASKNPGRTEKATESLGQVTGKRKALFVGINYKGQQGELRGCINDVNNIKSFLTSNYRIDEILVLTDVRKLFLCRVVVVCLLWSDAVGAALLSCCFFKGRLVGY